MSERLDDAGSTGERDPLVGVSLTLNGPGIRPSTVPISVVAKLLEAIEVLAKDMGGEPSELSIVSIREGSLDIGIVDRGGISSTAIGAVIAGASSLGYDGVPPRARRGWEKLAEAVPDGATLRLSERTRAGRVVEVHVEPLDTLPTPRVIRGRTTLYGQVRSANLGARRATIGLDATGHPRRVYCEVSEELARELARALGETISLEGVATWSGEDLSLIAFKADRRGVYRHRPLRTSLKRLSDVSSGRWDDVIVDDELAELRKS